MKKMSSNEIRKMFLDYFKEKGHLVVESAPLVPINDPTLLWINSGVAPLKKYFDGSIVPSNKRMTSSQKCIRTNDIENVGKTARHHTFFEMLGNFSIGDYFKEDAIKYAFELLTSDKYFGFDKDKLYMTIYSDDDVTYNLWLKEGVAEDHIIRLDTNFWEIGEGPSGPDSEIFYDRGPEFDKDNIGIDLLKKEIENDRYIELWNNVFSMYNAKEGVDRSNYLELPSKNIDTGMGLERMASIIQGAKTNFETDLFIPLILEVSKLSNKEYNGEMSFKVIADHIRTLTLALSDGATFSNEGRGYVLRRLLRRAVRYGKKLGIEKPFLYNLVSIVSTIMKEPYPYIESKVSLVSNLILKEEELFHKTLISGEQKLEELINNANSNIISGEEVFKLYDTYGFPLELTIEYLEEKGYITNKDEFDKCMLNQRELARKARDVGDSMNIQNELLLNFKEESNFIGYEYLNSESKVIALIKDGAFVNELDTEGYIVLDKTPFYAEAGGQVADTGIISNDNVKATVIDVIKAPHKQHLHYVKVEGIIKVNDYVKAQIDEQRRLDIAKNHSAAHLLHEALKEVFNSDVNQAGSKIDDKVLRFDFNYHNKISDGEIVLVEQLVNDKINTNTDSVIEHMTLEEAKAKGAVALFEDKYEETVRVLTLYDSIELCGGTHVKNVGDIKRFAIKSVESKGSNVYRVEAATDNNIEEELFSVIKPYNDEMIKLLGKAKRIIVEAEENNIELEFNFNIDDSAPKSYKDIVYNRMEVNNVRERVKELEKRYTNEKNKKMLDNLSTFDNDIMETSLGKVIITKTNNYEVTFLKELVDRLLHKIGYGFVFVANVTDNNVNYISKASGEISNKINCGEIIKESSLHSNGNGGGSKTYGQGGGTDISKLDDILNKIRTYIQNNIN